MLPDLTTAKGLLAYAEQIQQQTAAIESRPGMTRRAAHDGRP